MGGWLVLAHELEAQQAAARTVHTRGGTRVLGDKAHYRPTGTWLEHPKPVQEQVRPRLPTRHRARRRFHTHPGRGERLMGTILTSYGDAGNEHEGYVGQLLDDGTITGTYSNSTIPRMTGHVVAACGCGWTGTGYPTRELFDEQAHELALGEWEHTHAVPALSAAVRDRARRLPRLLSSLAADLDTRLGDATAAPERAAVLERTLRGLDDAQALAHDLLDHARGEHP